MATTQEVKVKMSADVAGAVNGLKQMSKSLEDLEKDLRDLQKSQKSTLDPVAFKNIQKEIDLTKRQISSLAASGKKDFTGLSRVVQDLPFGFTAISNNLTQLVPAAGAAGIAFSALVAILTFSQTGFANWTRGLGFSKNALDETTISLAEFSRQAEDAARRVDDLSDSLEFANKLADLRLNISFGKGLSTDLLGLQGASVANKEFLVRAKDEAAELSKSLQGITEKLLSELTGEQVALFDKGLLSVVAEDLDEDTKKIYNTYTDLEKSLSDIRGKILDAERTDSVVHAQIEQKRLDITEEANKKRVEAEKKAAEERRRRLEEEAKLRFALVQSIARDFVPREKPIPLFFNLEFAELQAKNNPSETIGQKLTKELLPKTIPLRVNVAPEVKVKLSKDEEDMIRQIEQLTESFNQTLQRGIGDGIGSFAEGIGKALAGGGLEQAFKSVTETMGSFLQQIGRMMIETAIKVKIFKEAFTKWIIANPGLAIAAGAGLVIAGSAIKAKAANVKPFAEGGLVFGPTVGMVGEGRGTSRSNPEVIAPLDKLKQFLGGGRAQKVSVEGELKLRGDTFRTALVQTQKTGRHFI